MGTNGDHNKGERLAGLLDVAKEEDAVNSNTIPNQLEEKVESYTLPSFEEGLNTLALVTHPEFTEAELNNLYKLFTKYSKPADTKGHIDLDGLKKLMETLDLTQTHLESKATYDKYAKDGVIKLDQYMRLVKDLMEKNGKINLEMVVQLASQEEVKVEDVGVGGAKRFFEAKARILEVGDAAYRAFEDKKKEAEERQKRQEEFKKKREAFQTPA